MSQVSANVKSKIALLLRRRVGSQREDKDFDEIVRAKHLHIFVFSMLGLGTMLLISTLTWFSSTAEGKIPPTDAYYNDPDVSPTLLNMMHLGQAIISSTTIVTIVLITQKYRLALMAKRAEWAGTNIFEVESFRGDSALDSQKRAYFNSSYSFFTSSLKWGFLAEVLIHIPHPVMWVAKLPDVRDDGVIPNLGFKMLQIFMFLRLYIIPNLLHLYSEAYRNRFEVVASDRDLASVGYQIRHNLTLKMLFYRYTAISLVIATIGSLIVFGYSMFSVERNEIISADPNAYKRFGKSENAFWFSYVTFTTVGYGEFVPSSTFGRVIAATNATVGITIFVILTAVLVSRIGLTKEQKHGVEYLKTRAGDKHYREAAEELIQTALMTHLYPKLKCRKDIAVETGKVVRHKPNRLYRAIKRFRAARRALEESFMQAEDVVINQKMEAVEQLIIAIRRELMDHQTEMEKFEQDIQVRFRGVLNKVAHYRRQGNIAV